MGQFISEAKRITLNESTKFIIISYLEAFSEVGIIEVPENTDEADYVIKSDNFHPNLLINLKNAKRKQGLANVFKKVAEKTTDLTLGTRYCILEKMSFKIDSDMHELFEDYLKEWSKLITTIDTGVVFTNHVDSKDIHQLKVNNAHVLTMHLIQRLLAFILTEENLTQIDHKRYFEAVKIFIKKITDDKTPFYTKKNIYDPLGRYLRNTHKEAVARFHDSIKSRALLSRHLRTLSETEDFIIEIEQIIKRQLIAYWDDTTEVKDMQPLSYQITLANVEDEWLENWLFSTRKNHCGQNIFADIISPEEKRTAIVHYAEHKKPPHQHIEIIKKLYTLESQIKDLKSLTKSIKSFMNSTGWLGLLAGLLKLSPLGNYLDYFIKETTEILDINKHNLNPTSPASNALLNLDSSDIFEVNYNAEYILESLHNLDKFTLHKNIQEKISSDLERICELQKKLGMEPLIDPEKLGSFSLTLKATTSENSPKSAKNEKVIEQRDQETQTGASCSDLQLPTNSVPKEKPLGCMTCFFPRQKRSKKEEFKDAYQLATSSVASAQQPNSSSDEGSQNLGEQSLFAPK